MSTNFSRNIGLKILAGLGMAAFIFVPILMHLFVIAMSEVVKTSMRDVRVVAQQSATSTARATENFALAGTSCDEAQGALCAPPLFCHVVKGKGLCADKTDTAPHIVSTRFEGLQPQDVGYVAQNKTSVNIEVTAVNIVKASVLLIADATTTHAQIDMKKTAAGKFAASLKLDTGFAGQLIILVTGKDGSTNSLLKRVATVE